MNRRRWSGTARRLFVAFAVLILIFASASLFALLGFDEIHTGLARTQVRVEGLRVALDLASAVRDQYAHQAHTIILGNTSHLLFHEQAKGRVLALLQELRRHVERPDERAWVDDIETATGELDRLFNDRIVPAVVAGQAATIQQAHGEALAIVGRIQERTDRLTKSFEQSIVELRSFALAVERRAFRWTVLFLIMAPLLAIGIGISVGRSVTAPVARLQAGAERIASGDRDTQIDIAGDDEFGALARQFNAMTNALKEHERQLVQSEKLAGIGRLAAGVAHEINNPLGVILGYVRVLAKKADAALAVDLAVIEEETLRCKEIVEGLLDLSRPLKAEFQPVDARELCDEVAARVRDSQPNGALVEVQGQGTLRGDPLKLRQVVFNLIKNAVEAAGDGGRVEVSISERERQFELRVSDSGPGIDPAVRDRLFEPFVSTKQRGTGLGLAVSQAIARAHGGEIAIASATSGGACFMLRLPRPAGEAT